MDSVIKSLRVIKGIKCRHRISLEGICIICKTERECDINLIPTVEVGQKLEIELVNTLYTSGKSEGKFLKNMKELKYDIECKDGVEV